MIERFIQRAAAPGPLTSRENRNRLGMLVGWVNGVASLVLALGKISVGVWASSVSLTADGINNAADICSSAFVVAGCAYARKPRDRKHPYGHGRMEVITAFILSLLLVLVGVQVIQFSILRLIHPKPLVLSPLLLWVIGVSLLVKVGLAIFSRRVGVLTRSRVVEAEAWNHTIDILSTLVVLVGVLGSRFGWMRADGVAGLLVALLIFYVGLKYALETISALMGEAPAAGEMQSVYRSASAVAGVEHVHDIIINDYGAVRMVSLHIEVDAAMTALEVHDISERVEDRVSGDCAAKVIVHADPVDRSHPHYAAVDQVFSDYVRDRSDALGYHDLRVTGDQQDLCVAADMVVDAHYQAEHFPELAEVMSGELMARMSGVRMITLGIESEYAVDPEFRKTQKRTG